MYRCIRIHPMPIPSHRRYAGSSNYRNPQPCADRLPSTSHGNRSPHSFFSLSPQAPLTIIDYHYASYTLEIECPTGPKLDLVDDVVYGNPEKGHPSLSLEILSALR
jgi:hypothetical protein